MMVIRAQCKKQGIPRPRELKIPINRLNTIWKIKCIKIIELIQRVLLFWDTCVFSCRKHQGSTGSKLKMQLAWENWYFYFHPSQQNLEAWIWRVSIFVNIKTFPYLHGLQKPKSPTCFPLNFKSIPKHQGNSLLLYPIAVSSKKCWRLRLAHHYF